MNESIVDTDTIAAEMWREKPVLAALDKLLDAMRKSGAAAPSDYANMESALTRFRGEVEGRVNTLEVELAHRHSVTKSQHAIYAKRIFNGIPSEKNEIHARISNLTIGTKRLREKVIEGGLPADEAERLFPFVDTSRFVEALAELDRELEEWALFFKIGLPEFIPVIREFDFSAEGAVYG
jgi:hypothetical protein